ncbi:hypothetical protein NOR_08603 [Metarhizium rileyi]|uniref:Uncharacterized protein n=1 Tax=Metarhizium rileyi (strain RCEF 4871) TaxID=1649241 RepID=A0A166VZQ8_METRR|nr:hypothetical protein NOR_08603 [Metarhizium rileyi RCEF 4871]
MNTPPTGVSISASVTDYMVENLCRRLEEVAESRARATPEPQFQDVETCHSWKCAVLLTHFKPKEADKHRMRISQHEYWEVECLHYMKTFANLMRQKGHSEDGEATADHWRALTMSYQKLLEKGGLSSSEIRKSRLSIDNQKYWQLEADLYERIVAQSEHEMREALLKKDESQRRRQARKNQPAAEPARRVQRPQPTNLVSGGIASRTKSRTSTGVTKRVLRQPQSRR